MVQLFKHIKYVLIVAMLLLIACEKDEKCSQSTISGMNFSLTKASDSKISKFIITPFSNVNDTLYASGTNTYIRTLPLSVSEDSSVFAFISNDTIQDGIKVYHSLKFNFIDEACGFVPEFKIDSLKYSNLGIDSIAWVFDEVTTDIENENIKLFY